MQPHTETSQLNARLKPLPYMQLVHRADGSTLAPAAERVIAQLARQALRPSDDIEEVRRHYEESRRPLLALLEDVDCVFQPSTRPGPSVYVIRPKHSTGRIVPAILYLHGGGWTVGNFATYEPLCRQLANATGSVVIYVRYRLAPEHPFPAAFEDARLALRWVHENHHWLRIDTDHISVAGDSAGGNLAAALCLAERDDRSPYQPRAQVLLYPCLDMLACLPSHKTLGKGYLLTTDLYHWYRSNYIGDFPKPGDSRLSPLFAYEVSGLPPAIVLYAGFDPLRDEAAAYAGRLRESGVPVESLYFPDMIHGFMTMGGAIPAAGVAVKRVSEVLKRLTSN